MSLKNFSIRSRLYVFAGFCMVMLGLIGGDGLWSLGRAERAFSAYVQTDVNLLTQMADLRSGVGQLRRFEKDLLINLGDVEQLHRYEARWLKQHENLATNLDQMLTLAPQGTLRERLASLQTPLRQYREGFSGIIQRVRAGEFADTREANLATEPIKAPVRALDKELDELTTALNLYGQEKVAELEEGQQRIYVQLLVAMAVGMVAVAVFTWFNVRSIVLPLQQAVESTRRIAEHDLSQALKSSGRDETALLMGSVCDLQNSLRQVVGGVRSSMDSISTAAREVSAGALDLSQRTEQTAARLEETASAMEQLTASVRHNTDAAQQASALANESAQVAQRGVAVVGDVVQTMGEISQSSRRIGEIIAVIDGIAFQTNILALNAAVEAARAGEQGRGFAVVAGEVRSLAQRSASAAKEIKQLITSSGERVDSGAQQVERAGATMGEIATSIGRVSALVQDMSHATREQNVGIGRVSEAIELLDQMTQQNAALVEESAAAAQSLQHQAEQLTGSVAVFRL
ncbi:methyl-accepting chemotaxis protein [Roseateles sp. BYS180W]|uniref:Methyl-accepting chemotaxis protein n=1 Tax=Roseateles rivi TaxID=3299028 RepID=A0ABW7FVB5_9BURK